MDNLRELILLLKKGDDRGSDDVEDAICIINRKKSFKKPSDQFFTKEIKALNATGCT